MTRDRRTSGLGRGRPGLKHPPMDDATFYKRFWLRVRCGDGCWEWTAIKNPQGYGIVCRDRKNIGAHRLSWQIHFGPIPAGMLVCHKCDNRLCVNPAHLFLGTHKDNMDDMRAKGRDRWTNAPRGERTGAAKLTEQTVKTIRQLHAAGHTQRQLAREYGVSSTTVRKLVHRETWRHVEDQ